MNNHYISKVFYKEKYKVLFTAILLIQIISLVYTGFQKVGLHIDEYYSYILSNSYEADRISNDASVWNNWVDGNSFQSFLSVEKGEQFAFHTVYENNAKDAHPPLFYFLLHFLCSLMPGFWSPWIGIIMNIVLISLTQIILYKLSRELMGDTIFSVAPIAIYGGMQLFFDTVLFVRMYPLLTLFTVLLVLQHYLLIKQESIYKNIILCGLITFLGVFTQYYFAIIAFFIAASCCLFLFSKKRWKPLFIYACSMLIGVIFVFIIFPAGITQITGSDTNNVGKEIAGNLFNFSGWGSAVLSMAKQMIVGMFIGIKHSFFAAVLCAIITVIALFALKEGRKKSDCFDMNEKDVFLLGSVLAIIIGFTILLISHISGKFSYVRYLYNLSPLIALLLGLISWLFANSFKLNKQILAWGIIVVSLISTVTIAKNNLCSYLFIERTEAENVIIEQCKDKPLVVLNNGSTYHPTSLLHIFIESNKMYMANYNKMESMDAVLEQVDCSNGVVYLILTDTYWSKGFDGDTLMTQIVGQSEILNSYENFGSCDFTTAYIALPEIG